MFSCDSGVNASVCERLQIRETAEDGETDYGDGKKSLSDACINDSN